MKKFIIATVAMLAIGTASFAQGFGWGVKAGLNVSGMSNTDFNAKTGLTAGVFADYRFNDWFGASAEVLFSREGGKITEGDSKFINKSNYLNIPIMAKFYVLDQLAFNIGIQPGVFLSAKAKVKDEGQESTTSIGKAYKSGDFAFPVGVSYEFFGKLILDARYNIGVVNVAHGETKSQNIEYALSVYYPY